MTRLVAVSMAISLLFTAVHAANPIFGAFVTPQCEECLDQTYQSCPGDYLTRQYAECLCAGDGGANLVVCMSQCDGINLNEPTNAISYWYSYCVKYFKFMCPEAMDYISDTDFDEECSSEVTAADGLSSTSVSGTGISANPTGWTSGIANQPTSGATAAAVPALVVIGGLGMQLINMNL